jgi:hypothetical protein
MNNPIRIYNIDRSFHAAVKQPDIQHGIEIKTLASHTKKRFTTMRTENHVAQLRGYAVESINFRHHDVGAGGCELVPALADGGSDGWTTDGPEDICLAVICDSNFVSHFERQ